MKNINEIISKRITQEFGKDSVIEKISENAQCFFLSESSKCNSKIGGITTSKLSIPNNTQFIVQIDLSEIMQNNVLPNKGFLYFYIRTDKNDSYPTLKNEFHVAYEDYTINVNNPMEKNKISFLKEKFMIFYNMITFPSYQESIWQKVKVSDDDIEKVSEIEEEALEYIQNYEYDAPHHILGHPNALQGTVRFWWAAKYLGFPEDQQFSEEDIFLIENEEDNFILLLQLNFADPNIEIDVFGDSIAYFGIHKNDLQNRNFENAVLVFQNT